jgi:16S rRNA (adenine1518-N6/adenine1519-N6)-dimethyltransferase
MKKLGQHFLKNASVIDKILKALEIEKNDRIIEIGPGHGELTVPLLDASERSGARITSIEKDHTLIAGLTALGEKEKSGRLSIVEGDALKDLATTVAADGSASYTIVGNIPYYITGKLLRVISELPQRPKRTVLMIQKEVAERVCATAPEMNRLAASVQFWADASIVTIVPRSDFSPAPDVDSAVILLETRAEEDGSMDPALYYRAVRGIFAQPRKTLLNNVSAMADTKDKKMKISGSLKKLGIDPESRPQDLTIEHIIAIANASPWG